MRIFPALLLIAFFLSLPAHASVDWMFTASGPIVGKPAVSGSEVVFASGDGKIYALDSAAGTLAWRVELGAKTSVEPVKTSAGIIAASDGGRLLALDATGKAAWEKNVRMPKSITSLGSGVFVLTNGSVTGFDAATGRLLWEYNASGADYFSTIGKTDAYVIAGIGSELVAFEPQRGAVMWRRKVGAVFGSRPVSSSGAVFVGSTDGRLYAINADSGIVRWTFQTNGWVQSTPYAGRDSLVFGSNDGYVYSLNPVNGELRWKQKTGEGVWSEPVQYSTNGARIIFAGSHDRKLYALDAETGRGLYSFASSDWIGSPALLAPSVVFGSQDGRVYSLSISPGCSYDYPPDASLMGDAEMEVRGRAFAVGGVQRVEVRVNNGQWKAADGTESWAAFIDTAAISDSLLKFECRAYGNDGSSERGPFYSSSGAIRTGDARPLELIVSAPAEAEAGKPFEVTVKNSNGAHLPKVTISSGDKKFEGGSPLSVTLSSSASLEIKKRGYDTKIALVMVKGDSLSLYALAALVAAGAIWFFVIRKRK